MKFYIVDDHIQIIKILENIIEGENLGDIIGFSQDGKTAINDIIIKRPEIVLIDMLMPGMDGTKVVMELKKNLPEVKFIMISQVSTKDLIEKAYDAGIEFFISKPINKIEVTRVLNNIIDKMEMENKFNTLKSLFKEEMSISEKIAQNDSRKDLEIKKIKIIFSKIGIMGEKGGEDILKVSEYLIEHDQSSYDLKLNDICKKITENPKAMEQRIRRAINKGLINLANLGIEDYMNEIFMRYSSTLYDFESVKAEMDYIRGKRSSGGKISVRKFIDNLLLHKDL